MRQPGAKSRNAEITQRLSRLEKLVGTLGHDPATLEKKLSQASPSHSDGSQDTSEPEKSIQTLQLQEYESINKSGGSRYMGSEFWSALSGEVGARAYTKFSLIQTGRWVEAATPRSIGRRRRHREKLLKKLNRRRKLTRTANVIL